MKKKPLNDFRRSTFQLEHGPALSGRRSIFIYLSGNSQGLGAYSEATARRLAKQLRAAADWVDEVWK